MAKGGKMTKLKSVIKKLNSFSKLRRTASFVSSSDEDYEIRNTMPEEDHHLHPVYVGKTRRRYLITPQVIANPLFDELVERSGENGEMIIGCEVVLFEHLLWMIENGADLQPESLAEFYACS